MSHEPVDPKTWRDRCARRIVELDPQLSDVEARSLAAEFQAFERTGVMEPEVAADFVVNEMSRPDALRFERRVRSRSTGSPGAA